MSSTSFTDAEGHFNEHQLPNEIIDEVVDNLQGNNEALKALSLSSRIFLHRARKHLYATLVLRVQNDVRKDIFDKLLLPSRKIFRLIKSAPHLIPYIQVLEIAEAASLNLDKEFSKALGLFQQSFETTSSLRHLCLYNITWSDLSIDIQAAVQHLLGFRSLKMVTFRLTDIPWTVFKEISPTVTALSLINALFWPWCGPPRDSVQAPLTKDSGVDKLRIEALFIAYTVLRNDLTDIFAHDSVYPLDLTHLRTFWVHVWSDEWWVVYKEFISHIVSHSLETLGINFSSFDSLTFFDFKTLPSLDCCQLDNLKHLHVETGCRSAHLPLQSAFLWLCESLETLPRQHRLQSIVIQCVIGVSECIDYQSQRGSWPEVKEGLGWEHIDMFLTQPRFDSLSQIRVVLVQGPGVKGPEYNGVLDSTPVLLPRMMAKGVVVLDNYKVQLYRHIL